MIRRPITRSWAVILGCLSMLLLLVGYTWVSHRQHQVNPDDTTIPSWSQMYKGVEKFIQPDQKEERWIVEDSIATRAITTSRLRINHLPRKGALSQPEPPLGRDSWVASCAVLDMIGLEDGF